MDQERDRIQADLRGLLEGVVRCDDVFVQMYASDASIFEIRPLGVVRPGNTADVVACVEYAAENNIPIHARGAGTGLAGESLGPGLVLDFSHFMRRIMKVDAETVTVQPGVVLSDLNRHLALHGRRFGPDPANRAVTTMGSVLAVDAAGSHWLRYGSSRQHVERLKIVMAHGEVVEIGRHALHDRTASATVRRLIHQVSSLVKSNQELISRHKPAAPISRAGYRLDDVLGDDWIDLARLLVGSEGTLGLITEATVRTTELPQHTAVALLLFERLESAANAAIEIPRLGASSCDLMDRRLLRLAAESDARYDLLLPEITEALLLVEVQGETTQEVRDKLSQIVNYACRRKKLAFDARMAFEIDDIELFWRLPQHVVPTLYRLKGSTRPLPFVEDIVVPPPSLPGILIQIQNVLKSHQVTASLFGHIGHGQLHVRPFLDLADPEHVRRMQHLARDLYEAVLKVGGTISGEHSDGLSRTWYLREQFGPLYDVFGDLKQIFDPQNIFNPGKIVDESGQGLTQNLRPVAPSSPRPEEITDSIEPDAIVPVGDETATPETVTLELNWDDESVIRSARACNGCGGCLTKSATERMCPIFRLAPAEEATPRAKANLVRAILTGSLDPTALQGESLKEIADLCVNCHQCRLECPAEVDIPKLMMECKSQFVNNNGLPPSDWFLTRLDSLAAWASLVRPFSNWAVGNRTCRWLLEKTVGIAQGRKLPRIAARSFLRQAARQKLTRPARRSGRKVLYFVDTFANWFDTQLAEALVTVMEHNGVAVYVHPEQLQSGMAMLSLGAVERARRDIRRNVATLAEAVRQGYHIVATEPAAALCLTREYTHVVDDEDAQLVADNSSEACSYLWKMHQLGHLELDLKPINATIGYHQPCHVRALQMGDPGENLLGLIPGLSIRKIDQGCSGMAGTYGLKRENYRNSLRAGWGLISAMRHPSIQVGATECSCCNLQMQQGTTKPTLHPLKLLALAYGLMPEVQKQMAKSSEELIAT